MVTNSIIWESLEKVSDPEIPALSIVDLGIVRSVEIENELCTITITPTYSGCPAMQTIEQEILKTITPIIKTEVKSTLTPAWTTDWMSENGRNKLREYGIAPPENEVDKSVLFAKPTVVPCPKCASSDTKMVSQFGSTACKAHYQCNQCLEPFDYFKCLR